MTRSALKICNTPSTKHKTNDENAKEKMVSIINGMDSRSEVEK